MKPIKGMHDKDMTAVFKEIYEELEIQNCKPKLHILNDQCSKTVKSYIQKEKDDIQLVEPYNHHVNAADSAAKTAKYHIVTGLGTADVNRLPQLWCKFLP